MVYGGPQKFLGRRRSRAEYAALFGVLVFKLQKAVGANGPAGPAQLGEGALWFRECFGRRTNFSFPHGHTMTGISDFRARGKAILSSRGGLTLFSWTFSIAGVPGHRAGACTPQRCARRKSCGATLSALGCAADKTAFPLPSAWA